MLSTAIEMSVQILVVIKELTSIKQNANPRNFHSDTITVMTNDLKWVKIGGIYATTRGILTFSDHGISYVR